MKVCVIGCGGHANAMLGPSYKKYRALHPQAELSACCDASPDAAAAFADKFGFIRTYENYTEMLINEKPDAVGIAVPVQLTQTITEQVMKLGYSCIIEKPPAMTASGVRSLVRVEKECGVQLRVAFNRRFMPVIRVLKEQFALRAEPMRYLCYDMQRVGRFDEDFTTTALYRE